MTRRRDGSRRTRRILIPSTLVMLTCCVALATAGEPQGETTTPPAEVGGPVQVEAPGELSPAQEEAIKRGAAPDAPVRVAVEIDDDALAAWPRLEAVPAHLTQPLASAEAIGLPVLLPGGQGEALESAVLTVGDGWYEASMHLDGGQVMVVVAGSTRAVVHAGVAEEVGDLAPFQNEHGAIVGRTHSVVSASFVRFGEVAYMVDVECAAPETDTRCTEDAFVNDIIGALALAGGR